MKNNIYIKITVIFFFGFFLSTNIYSEEIKIDSSELNILEGGNILEGKNGFKSYSDTGLKITGDEFRYNKIKNTLKAEGNIIINDIKQNLVIENNRIKYFKNEDKIFFQDVAYITINNEYFITSYDVVYDKKNNLIFSNQKTELIDLNQNKIYLNKFNFNTYEKIFSGNEVKLVDKENSEYLFSEFKLDITKKEFIGKDLSYEMKNLNSEKPRLKGLSIISNNNVSKIYKGTYTTCAKRKGCSPWIIQAEEITHNKESKLIDYKNAWLKIYDVPIMYFPKFFHPDPTVKRQSGFLAPTFSDSSSAGFSVNIPYFYAISIDKDLTFKPRIFGANSAIIQNEYRKVGKNSSLTSDFSTFLDEKGSKSHFFVNTIFEDISDYFDESSLTVKLENTTNDTYLNKYSISSPIIKDRNLLTSLIDYKGSNDDLNINIYSKVYENLNEKRSDRFEFILPYVSVEKKFKDINFKTISYYKKNNTNQDIILNKNDLLYSAPEKIFKLGTKQDWYVNLINLNKETNKTSDIKNSRAQGFGAFIYNLSYPLKKNGEKYLNFLSPKISLRYSPNKTKNLLNEDRRLDLNNIFSLNRLSLFDTIETGESASLGIDYELSDKLNNDIFLKTGLAQVFRMEQNKDLPLNSTIGNKSSNIFGNLNFKYKNLVDFKSNYSFDEDLRESNYNYYDLKFNVNNFITEFIYLDNDISISEQGYFNSSIQYNFNKNNSLSYSRRENTKTNLIEYNNIIYEYKLDCLTAGIEYKKKYYDNQDIKPEDEIYFSLTISSFGKFSGPNVK
tara:strand:- start:154 stop:2508 length:2355 start_codon:yes stop_codon:yes gene_type:complete